MQFVRSLKVYISSRPVVRAANAVLLVCILVPIAATERLPASFSGKVTRVVVQIDNVNYGAFVPVSGLNRLAETEKPKAAERIALSRDFVTDPSLYLWANSLMQGNSSLKDITLISENAEGVEVARHILRRSQPVSWTVETSNPEVGGLHEKVEFAVQKVDRL